MLLVLLVVEETGVGSSSRRRGRGNQSNAQGVRAKIFFFIIFFISFHVSIYLLFASEKPAFFDQMRKFALLRGTPAPWDTPFAIPSGSILETSFDKFILPIRFEKPPRHLSGVKSIINNKLCKTNPISEKPK